MIPTVAEIAYISKTVDDFQQPKNFKGSQWSQWCKKCKKCKKCKTHKTHKKLPTWTSELHGLAQLLKATTWYTRVFWTLVMGGCFLNAVWFSKVLLSAYIEGQTVTSNTFEGVDKLPYPNIIVCPKQADSLKYDVLRRDIDNRLQSRVNDTEFYDMLNYVVAGWGIHGMDNHMRKWKGNYSDHLYERVTQWRFNRTWDEFFHFVFHTNGYECEDLFERCSYGYYEAPCCDYFRPTYVLKRGRCFRLDEFYQKDEGDPGMFIIHMKNLPSNFVNVNGTQPHLILYLSTREGDVNNSPRLFMNKDARNEIRLQLKRIEMLPSLSQQHCSNSSDNINFARCATNAWLNQQLIDPFNCSLHPYRKSRPATLETCDPNIIIKNYEFIMKKHVPNNCLPACFREDIREQKFIGTSGQSITKMSSPYMLQMQFTELRVEVYKEIYSITIPEFISELGGQVTLYLGVSLNTVIQLMVLVVSWIRKKYMG